MITIRGSSFVWCTSKPLALQENRNRPGRKKALRRICILYPPFPVENPALLVLGIYPKRVKRGKIFIENKHFFKFKSLKMSDIMRSS